MNAETAGLVLRLAAPLQSWGGASRFNRRDTEPEPTRSGIIGLLAAAQGRRRADPIEDLVGLSLGVRTDQPGTVLRDYHTVSDYTGASLRSAAVDRKGRQRGAGKLTHVTERYYLQDAVFVAAVAGPPELIAGLAEALARPAFPLALGRRSCPPTLPLLVSPGPESRHSAHAMVWSGNHEQLISAAPWQAAVRYVRSLAERRALGATIALPATLDDPAGDEVRADNPTTFAPTARAMTTRRVRSTLIHVPTGRKNAPATHDPLALLGW